MTDEKILTIGEPKAYGADYLSGFFAADGEISLDVLKKYMRGRLPEYMLPSVMMRVDAMLLTSSWKINKRALPLPDFSEFRVEYTAPETGRGYVEQYAGL